jgi:hypothetical protein
MKKSGKKTNTKATQQVQIRCGKCGGHYTPVQLIPEASSRTPKCKTPPPVGPEALFEGMEGRDEAGVPSPKLHSQIEGLRVGDVVKVAFKVTGIQVSELPVALREWGTQVKSERMHVKLTRVRGGQYQGQLLDMPIVIDPDTARRDSPVTFEARHIDAVA